jgi:hypothetical protein
MNCPLCGLTLAQNDFVSEVGDLASWLCPTCGKKSWATVCRVINGRDETRVRAVVRWKGEKPSPRELLALRAVVPAFRDRGIADVAEAVRDRQSWELGEFSRPYAQAELTLVTRQHGLLLELQEILA